MGHFNYQETINSYADHNSYSRTNFIIKDSSFDLLLWDTLIVAVWMS